MGPRGRFGKRGAHRINAGGEHPIVQNFPLFAMPGTPYRDQIGNREMTSLGSKGASFGGPSRSHLGGLLGAFLFPLSILNHSYRRALNTSKTV